MIDIPVHDSRFVSPIAPAKRRFNRRLKTLGSAFHAVKLVNVAKTRHVVTEDRKIGDFSQTRVHLELRDIVP
jgi:hypothetical protein